RASDGGGRTHDGDDGDDRCAGLRPAWDPGCLHRPSRRGDPRRRRACPLAVRGPDCPGARALHPQLVRSGRVSKGKDKHKKKGAKAAKKLAQETATLHGISEIRRFFRTNETPIYFVSATAFN